MFQINSTGDKPDGNTLSSVFKLMKQQSLNETTIGIFLFAVTIIYHMIKLSGCVRGSTQGCDGPSESTIGTCLITFIER